jgi:aryl-phospho-beta-D-glucosidase BglC (GH1 family)
MLKNGSITSGINFQLNPDLQNMNPIQCLDIVLKYCNLIQLNVILDRHSAKSDNYQNEDLWYIPGDMYYNEDQFISDWVMLAQRYHGTNVIGADLWNEPKGQATWGTNNYDTDWNKAAERVGEAILAVNSNWLIIVEGVGTNTWWGGNLQGVAFNPISLSQQNKVVYSVHEYSFDSYNQTWLMNSTFPSNLKNHWNSYFGFIVQQQIAPVFIGAFGTSFKYPKDSVWLTTWSKYINGDYNLDGVIDLSAGQKGMSYSSWPIDPYSNIGGILGTDWSAVDQRKISFLKLLK